MKKLLVFLAVAAIAYGAWWYRGYADKKAAIEGPQGAPDRAVEAFLSSVARLTQVMYDESKLAELKAAAEKLESNPDADTKKETKDIFEKYGLDTPYYVFADEKYAKSVLASLLFFSFDSFTIDSSTVTETAATVTVSIKPKDVLGIGAAVEKSAPQGAPPLEMRKAPSVIPFDLEKRGHRWYITRVSGELEELITIMNKFRR